MPSGGKRERAGRKSQWLDDDKTIRSTFQLPASKADEIKEKIEKILKKYRKKEKSA